VLLAAPVKLWLRSGFATRASEGTEQGYTGNIPTVSLIIVKTAAAVIDADCP